MTLPDWLRRHLEATGRANPDGVSRRARAGICRSCGAHVIRGLDGDRIAGAATADPTPLDVLGEVLAIAAGRTTYEMRWAGDHYEIDHRDQWCISGRPAGSHKDTTAVIPNHRCGQQIPAATEIPRPDRTKEIPVEPPF